MSIPSDVRDIFHRFDRNRSGRLDYRELRNALTALSLDTSHSHAAKILTRYDSDQNGLLELDEFANLCRQLREWQWATCPPDVRDTFLRFDANKSGRLNYAELRNALQALGFDTSHHHSAGILNKYDRDRNGALEIEEFANLCRQLREWQWSTGQWPPPPLPPTAGQTASARSWEEKNWRCHLVAETGSLVVSPIGLPEGTRWRVSVWCAGWYEQMTTETTDPQLQLNISSLRYSQSGLLFCACVYHQGWTGWQPVPLAPRGQHHHLHVPQPLAISVSSPRSPYARDAAYPTDRVYTPSHVVHHSPSVYAPPPAPPPAYVPLQAAPSAAQYGAYVQPLVPPPGYDLVPHHRQVVSPQHLHASYHPSPTRVTAAPVYHQVLPSGAVLPAASTQAGNWNRLTGAIAAANTSYVGYMTASAAGAVAGTAAAAAEAAMAPAPAQTHEAMRAHAAVDIMAKSQGDQEAAQEAAQAHLRKRLSETEHKLSKAEETIKEQAKPPVEPRPPTCLETAPHLPPWAVRGLRPLPHDLERRSKLGSSPWPQQPASTGAQDGELPLVHHQAKTIDRLKARLEAAEGRVESAMESAAVAHDQAAMERRQKEEYKRQVDRTAGQLQAALATEEGRLEGQLELKKLFIKLDVNGSGGISATEWAQGMAAHGDVMAKYFGGATYDDLARAFERIDRNGDGRLTWDELVKEAEAFKVASVRASRRTSHDWGARDDYDSRRRLDYDERGYDDRALRQLSDALAREDGRTDLRRLFNSLDRNRDGRISATEWAQGMSRDGPAMARYFGGTTYEDLARAFDRIDTNRSGYINWDEMERATRRYRSDSPERQRSSYGRDSDDERALQQLIDALARQDGKDDVRRLFHSIDTNGDGRISREEWARGVLRDGPAMAKYFGGTTYEGLIRAFDRIDANRSGYININELLDAQRYRSGAGYSSNSYDRDHDRALQSLADALARDDGKTDLRRLFNTLDRNGDGRISSTEWARGMANHRDTMTKYFGGLTYDDLSRAFTKIDTMGRNYLTWDEIENAARRYRSTGSVGSSYGSGSSYREDDRALQQLADALALDSGKSDLRRLFSKLDRNGDGRISSTEWARGMSTDGTTMTKYFGGATYEDLAHAFTRIDTNGSGYLNFDEIVSAAQRFRSGSLSSAYSDDRALQQLAYVLDREEGRTDLRRLFVELDRNGDGRISSTEWARGMSSHGHTMTKYFGGTTYEQLSRAFTKMDTLGRGELTWDEIVSAAQRFRTTGSDRAGASRPVATAVGRSAYSSSSTVPKATASARRPSGGLSIALGR